MVIKVLIEGVNAPTDFLHIPIDVSDITRHASKSEIHEAIGTIFTEIVGIINKEVGRFRDRKERHERASRQG